MLSYSVPRISWSKLYTLHGKEEYPCDQKAFENQCAIRLGHGLRFMDINMRDFQGATCGLKGHDPNPKENNPGHILRARELANYLRAQTRRVGKVKIYKKATPKDFENRRGIMFIQKPTGLKGLDHIDLWDGQKLKTREIKDNSWISACDQVWFWDLWPSIVKPEGGGVTVYRKADTESDLLSPPSGLIKTNRPVEVHSESRDGRFLSVNMAKFDDPTDVEDEKMGFIESRFIELPEPLAETTQGVVTASSLQIRKDHSTRSATVAGSGLREGGKVTIQEIWSDGKDTWAKLADDQWAAIESNGETLIEGVF
jgi:hypothetical protein